MNAIPYEDMSREELKAEAVRHKINLAAMGGKTSNEEIIAALVASDRAPKEEQAQSESIGEPVTNEDAALMEEAELASMPDYSSMTKAEVLELAESRGMVVKTNTSKTEAVDWLMAAAGVTEDEQAEMDEPPTEG